MGEGARKAIKKIQKITQPVIRACPCFVGHVSCDYRVISQILGCPYDCSYCFLNDFYGQDEIVIYDNDDDILTQVKNYLDAGAKPLRVGTGQYSDSLALKEARALAVKLIALFAQQERHLLELKTKSAEVDELLGLQHNGKTVIAWSVNPEEIVRSNEYGVASSEYRVGSLKDRLAAAQKCVAAGYKVAFHFDPIYHYAGWEKDYCEVVDLIFQMVKPADVGWISLGALRYKKKRYPEEVRVEIFQKMQQFIRYYSQDLFLYLCMETEEIWQKSGIINNENDYFTYSRR